jgi:glycosyltransferase involved in cell wall biosynthesis
MTFSGRLGKLMRFAEWYLRVFFEFRRKRPTFINCHSLSVLPLGVLFSWLCGSRLIYDTHELETETSESKGLRKVFAKFLERALIGQSEAVIVVCDSIGRWYRDTYKLIEVHVVRNIPHARPIPDRKSKLLRQMFGVGDGESLFIVQGIMDIGRGIDITLESFSEVDSDKHVVFFGNGSLQRELVDWSRRHPNIHYHPAVPPQELLELTAGADVGIALIENTCLSYYYCLPNKIFEYLLCGLPVIVSDFPEMAKIVDKNGCGWKSAVNTVSLIELLRSITPQEIAEKTIAAKERASKLGWHNEERILIDLYKRLLKCDDE